MPVSPPKVCSYPGCNELTQSSRCDKHVIEKKYNWSHTESTTERGYGAAWRKTRDRILSRDFRLCQCKECKSSNRVRSANEVDHIVSRKNAQSLGWSNEEIESDDNLQAINKECHKHKTSTERGRGG